MARRANTSEEEGKMDPWLPTADREAEMPHMETEQWLEKIPIAQGPNGAIPPDSQTTLSSRRERDIAAEAKRHSAIENWSKAAEAENDDLAAGLAQAAFHLLLSAWAQRLGYRVPTGWWRYSKKTTTRACLEIRELVKEGDPETGLKFEDFARREEWEGKLASVRWWFDTANDAIDFLSFLGRGANRFGQAVVRVDAARYNDLGTHDCVSPDHEAAMSAFYLGTLSSFPEPFEELAAPRPDLAENLALDTRNRNLLCACADQSRLLKLLAKRQGVDFAETNRVLEHYALAIRQRWLERNDRARREGDMRDLPYVIKIDGKEVRTSWWRERLEELGMEVIGLRVEGAVGELL